MRRTVLLAAVLAGGCAWSASSAETFPGFDRLRNDRKGQAAYMLQRLDQYWKTDAPAPAPRTAKLIYFHPADRQPCADYEGRINRWMDDFQKFFRVEFTRNGFGERQLALERAAGGGAKIHLVKGAKPDQEYNYKSGQAIFDEVIDRLKDEFNVREETVLIICGLSRTETNGAIKLYAPFYGMGGSQKAGVCFCVDHELLDAQHFAVTNRTLDLTEHQRREMSLGEFNTIYLGGALHEFGHGLGLPHDHETSDERKLGVPLMGSGNYTYRNETRGSGKPTYLSFSEAARLISHPLFSGHSRSFREQPQLSHNDISFTETNGQLLIRGTLKSDIPPYVVVAYNDPCPPGKRKNNVNEDYDAETWTSVVNEEGQFEIKVGRLPSGTVQLRLTASHLNGAFTTIRGISQGYTNAGPNRPLVFYGGPANPKAGASGGAASAP